jgi:DNA-3-methyladenine glycosylase
MTAAGRALPRSFFERPATVVAPELLGLVLAHDGCAARIVEVEAYEPDDPASHSFIGPRPRTASMFGPPGHLYVYRSYGVHWCANVVCGPAGVGAAVLLRAGEPLAGLPAMASRRAPASGLRQLCSGPGKLCAALAVDGDHDGTDLCRTGGSVLLRTPGTGTGAGRLSSGVSVSAGAAWWTPPAGEVVSTTRIGISKAVDRPWRWLERANPHVSRPPTTRRSGRATVPA